MFVVDLYTHWIEQSCYSTSLIKVFPSNVRFGVDPDLCEWLDSNSTGVQVNEGEQFSV